MLKRQLGTLFLAICLILIVVPNALCAPSAQKVTVARDGSGDFNCDGKDDHVQINQALKFVAEHPECNTVYLKGGTYFIDDTLLIGSNTILEGDSSATIKLVSNAGWPAWKPLLKERSSGCHDITIGGFTIDGNRDGNKNVGSGNGYYNLIHLSNCRNVNVNNMYLTNNQGDGVKLEKCSNVKLYNNKIYLLGHDGFYIITCSNVEAYKNTITCRSNSGIRVYNSNHVKIHNNYITSEGSGGAGIQIQRYRNVLMDDIEVYDNTIYKTRTYGIWVYAEGSCSSTGRVYLHDNTITATRAIVASGLKVVQSHNVVK
jgi:polygalacturonase